MNIQNDPISCNYSTGRFGATVTNIICHTEVGRNKPSWDSFNTPGSGHSANYLIGENGEIICAVGEGDTAWHAANWQVNKSSIGIEHEDMGNYNDPVRTDAEYASSAELVADICRRYGIPCQRVGVTNHIPDGPGIALHREVSQAPGGTACPDGLDVERIIRQAQAILGGATVQPIPAPAPDAHPTPDFVPLNQAVNIKSSTLIVRSGPGTSFAGGVGIGTGGDGNLHADQVITIHGYTPGGQDVNGDPIWLYTVFGHWIWSGGTNFDWQSRMPQPAEAVVTDHIGKARITGTGTDGLNVRTLPSTSSSVVSHVDEGTDMDFIGFVEGESVNGNTKWYKNAFGHYFSAAFAVEDTPAMPVQPSTGEAVSPSTGLTTPDPIVAAPPADPVAFMAWLKTMSYQTDAQVRPVKKSAAVVDYYRSKPSRSVLLGQVIHQAGTFVFNGQTLALTETSLANSNGYGVPTDAFDPHPNDPVGPLLDGIMSPVLRSEASKIAQTVAVAEHEATVMSGRERLVEFLAAIYGAGAKIVGSMAFWKK